LNEKEQKVITSYFYNKVTLKEISEELNLTESRISQIKKAAVNKLKTKLKVIENEI
jgi:RNA polymerase sigma factor for flagellar operon FliA